MFKVTAHCLVKNEENFIWYAIKSIIEHVDYLIIYDTGSTDKTIDIIQGFIKEYPNKIIFEEKGECDKATHTLLRQEMLDKTSTEWFMILDGDEVWTKEGIREALSIIQNNLAVECLVAPFHLCVGDIWHETNKHGEIDVFGKFDFHFPRLFKICKGIKWSGIYEKDTLYDSNNNIFFDKANTLFLSHRYWHLTHLKRSSKDNSDYTSGGVRKKNIRDSYFMIGKRINENLPEVFDKNLIKLNFFASFVNFIKLLRNKI